jgi:hypothetical protein
MKKEEYKKYNLKTVSKGYIIYESSKHSAR